MRGRSHLARPLWEAQQICCGLCPCARVDRIDQGAVDAVCDLVLDASDRGGHHGRLLPHRLRHGQAEGLHERALGDDVGDALNGVDHRRIDLPVVRGHRRDVHPARHRFRQEIPAVEHLAEDRGRVVVAARVGVRADDQQMRIVGQGVEIRDEGVDEFLGPLESIPAPHLHDRAHPRRDRQSRAGQGGHLPDRVGAAVLVHEGDRIEGRLAGEDPRQARHGPGLVQVQDPVLGGVGVDRGLDDGAALRLDEGRAVLLAGDDHQVDVLQVPIEEGPGALGLLASLASPQVAAPDNGGAGASEGFRQAGCGRIVEDDDIALADLIDDIVGIRRQHVLVEVPLLVAELAAVSPVAVDARVQARRHALEVRGRVQGEPARVHAQAECVAHQGADRLRGPGARRGRRRHRPHGAPFEQEAGGIHAALEAVAGHLVQVALELQDGQGGYVDTSHELILHHMRVMRGTFECGVSRDLRTSPTSALRGGRPMFALSALRSNDAVTFQGRLPRPAITGGPE